MIDNYKSIQSNNNNGMPRYNSEDQEMLDNWSRTGTPSYNIDNQEMLSNWSCKLNSNKSNHQQ